MNDQFLDLGARLHAFADRKTQVLVGARRCRQVGELLETSNLVNAAVIDELVMDPDQLARVRRKLARSREVVIADVDQDGLFLSRSGRLGGLPEVSATAFLPRKRNQLDLVATRKGVAVRKRFAGDRYRFFKELRVLDVLMRTGCRVPHLFDADPVELTITTAFVRGQVLREKLAAFGAQIRDREFIACGARPALDRILEGKRFLYRAVDQRFIELLWEQLLKMHDAGVVWNDVKYGNVIVEESTGMPCLIDFDRAYYFPRKGYLYRGLRSRDLGSFNKHFR